MTMKSTTNRMNKLDGQAAKRHLDIESLLRAGRQQYHNTAVESTNAEVYALRHAVEEMFTLIQEQGKTIAQQQMQINALTSQMVRRTGVVSVERTITERVDVEYAVQHGDDDMVKQYRKGTNIMWGCGIAPVEIAFNEFDIYRRDNKLYTMITPDVVRIQWSTLAMQSKRITGMPLGRLLKEYARSRKLNY